MGILYVNWNRMDQAACGAKQVSRRLQETSEEILFVKNSLKFSGAYSDTLDSRLKQLSHGIAAQSRAAEGVGTLLTKAAKRYRSCENAIAQDSMLGSGKKSIKEVFGDKVIPIPRAFEMTDSGRMYLEFFKKFLGQFGAAGKPLVIWFKTSDDENNIVDNILFVGKGTVGAIGAIAAWMSQGMAADELADYLLGVNLKNIPKDTNFWKALQREFSEYVLENGDDATKAAKVGNRLSVGAKWAGALLDLIGNAADNYSAYESGDISGGRAVAETTTETVIDVGTDAAIGAGLTALLTFFGITSAPAVAVGGGVIAVKWSLDSSFEYLFGSDFSETISDGILDMGEYIWDSASQKWDEFSDYVSDAWDGITDAASDAVDYAFDFADDVKDSIGEAANNVKDGVHSAWNDFSNWVFG